MSDDESFQETSHTAEGGEAAESGGDENEAKRAMEEAARKKAEKMKAELEEFEESRKEQKLKEQQEIEDLRQKRAQRKIERAEEDRINAEKRKEEEARRKAAEEERRQKKQAEEDRRKAERAAKLKEMEEKMKLAKKPNFVIVKKDGEKETEKESTQKSKEQLEEEKRAILAKRIIPLVVDGLDSAGLKEKATELHAKLLNLANQKYELEEQYKRQQYDMIELAERARQMNKGKSKRGAAVQVDESFDRLADKFPSAPPKIQMYSKYERHTDHRSYCERIKLFEDISAPVTPQPLQKKAETGGGDQEGEGGEAGEGEE